MPTDEGTTGRVVGFLWGSTWLSLGTGRGLWVLDSINALPSFVVAVVPEFLRYPSAQGIQMGFWSGAIVLFVILTTVHGGYELAKVFFESDYSIRAHGPRRVNRFQASMPVARGLKSVFPSSETGMVN